MSASAFRRLSKIYNTIVSSTAGRIKPTMANKMSTYSPMDAKVTKMESMVGIEAIPRFSASDG